MKINVLHDKMRIRRNFPSARKAPLPSKRAARLVRGPHYAKYRSARIRGLTGSTRLFERKNLG